MTSRVALRGLNREWVKFPGGAISPPGPQTVTSRVAVRLLRHIGHPAVTSFPTLARSRCATLSRYVRPASATVLLNSTNGSTVRNFQSFVYIDFASTVCCSTAVRTGLHNASVSNIASLRTSSNIPKYMSALLAMFTRVDVVSDVTSDSTVLPQSTGKVVWLNIQFDITNSTTVIWSVTVVKFNTTMTLVLMERCNFVSASTETEATGHFTLDIIRGFRTYIT